jgi:hypothetical protein
MVRKCDLHVLGMVFKFVTRIRSCGVWFFPRGKSLMLPSIGGTRCRPLRLTVSGHTTYDGHNRREMGPYQSYFPDQHLKIMLEVEHVLAPLMATLVPRNLFATPILWDFSTFLWLKIGPNSFVPPWVAFPTMRMVVGPCRSSQQIPQIPHVSPLTGIEWPGVHAADFLTNRRVTLTVLMHWVPIVGGCGAARSGTSHAVRLRLGVRARDFSTASLRAPTGCHIQGMVVEKSHSGIRVEFLRWCLEVSPQAGQHRWATISPA